MWDLIVSVPNYCLSFNFIRPLAVPNAIAGSFPLIGIIEE